jgi:hypothetical protein
VIRIIIFILGLFTIVGACSNGAESPKSRNSEVVVYYYWFDVERITGIPEHQIEVYGCLYSAEKEGILNSISLIEVNNINYDSSDVRAKIILEEKVFFIDYKGVVKSDNNFFKVDKASFVKSLKPVANCKR